MLSVRVDTSTKTLMTEKQDLRSRMVIGRRLGGRREFDEDAVRDILLFRWLVGLAIEGNVWDHSVFSKNRDCLLEHAVIEAFFTEVMRLADKQGMLPREHFSVGGTLIQAWASHKSFSPKALNTKLLTGPQLVTKHLSSGGATLEHFSAAVDVTLRTLQRRLVEEGGKFSLLHEQVHKWGSPRAVLSKPVIRKANYPTIVHHAD